MADKKTIKKSPALKELKKLTPKKQVNRIIILPDEIEDGLHWLFWVLVILVIVFMVSAVVINYTDFPKTLSLLF